MQAYRLCMHVCIHACAQISELKCFSEILDLTQKLVLGKLDSLGSWRGGAQRKRVSPSPFPPPIHPLSPSSSK